MAVTAANRRARQWLGRERPSVGYPGDSGGRGKSVAQLGLEREWAFYGGQLPRAFRGQNCNEKTVVPSLKVGSIGPDGPL